MPYLGQKPKDTFVASASQTITGTGATAYSLNQAVTAPEDIEVFINNVQQQPTVAYTVSGQTITFDEALESTDACYVVFRGARTESRTHPAASNLQAANVTASALTVSGNTTLSGDATVSGAFTSQGIDDNADATAMTIDSSERVGIGITTPGATLHVAKASTPAVNTNATETVMAFGVDGNEHGHIRAHATTMNSSLRSLLYDTDGGSNAYGYGIHGYHTRFVDIGRADQGNYFDGSNGDGRYLGGLSQNPRYTRWWAFGGSILANNTYYPIAYNMNEAKFTIEIFCGDASSRDYKKYVGYYTSPAYGVYGLTQILHVNGGWNSGTPNLRVAAPNGALSIDLQFQSYYSSSNVASYKCIFTGYV